MDNSNKQEFATLLTGITEVYGTGFSTALQKIWFEALKCYSVSEVSQAISKHIRCPDKGRYQPKPADIIFFLEGTSTDSAFLAWTKVSSTIEKVGVYQSVVFDDSIIHAVISDMGGWISFGDIDNNDMKFKANEFQKRYQGYKMRGELNKFPSKMIGLTEANNITRGFTTHIPEPLLIGDGKKAKLVLVGEHKTLQVTG